MVELVGSEARVLQDHSGWGHGALDEPLWNPRGAIFLLTAPTDRQQEIVDALESSDKIAELRSATDLFFCILPSEHRLDLSIAIDLDTSQSFPLLLNLLSWAKALNFRFLIAHRLEEYPHARKVWKDFKTGKDIDPGTIDVAQCLTKGATPSPAAESDGIPKPPGRGTSGVLVGLLIGVAAFAATRVIPIAGHENILEWMVAPFWSDLRSPPTHAADIAAFFFLIAFAFFGATFGAIVEDLFHKVRFAAETRDAQTGASTEREYETATFLRSKKEETRARIRGQIEQLDNRISRNLQESLSSSDSVRKYELLMQREKIKERRMRLANELSQLS